MKGSNDKLTAVARADSSQGASVLVFRSSICEGALPVHFGKINKVKKLDKWVWGGGGKQKCRNACFSVI